MEYCFESGQSAAKLGSTHAAGPTHALQPPLALIRLSPVTRAPPHQAICLPQILHFGHCAGHAFPTFMCMYGQPYLWPKKKSQKSAQLKEQTFAKGSGEGVRISLL